MAKTKHFNWFFGLIFLLIPIIIVVMILEKRRLICIINLFVWLVFYCSVSIGQAADIKFKHITIEDGLSQSTVTAILQDDFGFIWIGTADGLNRYDGYEFTVFRYNPADPSGICGDYINALAKDDSGCIWIGTDMGLSMFDPKTEQFNNFKTSSTNQNSLSHNLISAILPDRHRKSLWIGTRGGGLNWFDPLTQTFVQYKANAKDPKSVINNTVNSLCFSDENSLWIGTDGGLDEFSIKDKYFYHHPLKRSDKVRSLLYQTEGFLWIGTDKGLEYMRLPARQIEPTPFVDHIFPNTDDRVKTIFLDSKKYLWLGYYLDGLYRIDMKNHQSWHIKRDDYNQWETYYREINTIFEDTQNRIWIGTWDSGLHVHDPCMKPFHHFYHMPTNPNSINTNLIRGMFCDDRGIVWIGTNGGGLNRFDPQIKQFTHYKHSPQNSVNISKNIISCIFQDSAKKLWVGTQRGIGIYDPYSEKLLPLPAHMPFPDIFKNSNIYTIIEDGQSGLWYGSNNGLFHYQPLDKTVRLFQHQPDNQNSLTSNTIWDLLEDHQKMIWIATHSTGISHFDPKTDSFTHYRHQPNQPNSLSSNRVYVLCETQDHRLWIGTNRGLNLFNPTNQSFTHYTVSQGLPNNKIYGIIEDNNHQLWLSTNNGLCRFDPDSLQVTNFFKEDGLQSNEFNDRAFAKDQNGRLYFGGINGFNVFDPAEIKKNPLIPTVILTGFQLFNKTIHPQDKVHGKILMHQSISITNKLTLSYQDKLISFSFVALNLTASSKNQYAYKMEGFDQDWNYCGTRRSAFYTNLPAGHYTFRVIACNNDGVWNETGAHIQLTVTPPFWQTWWFYSLLFLSILITLLFLHFYRVKTVILQERKKYELPAELIDEYSDQLINKMDSKKYYLQSTLTLNELAGYLSIPAYQLSHIINNKQNKNFNEFINEYRINEAKRILETSKDAKINILELAYQTGFNSKSVFNSSFKKFTGQTPSQFKRNNHPD